MGVASEVVEAAGRKAKACVPLAAGMCGMHASEGARLGYGSGSTTRTGLPVAKPNYAFEKRQRELEKKRKKEEKAQRKAAAQTQPQPDSAESGEAAASPGPTDGTSAPEAGT